MKEHSRIVQSYSVLCYRIGRRIQEYSRAFRSALIEYQYFVLCLAWPVACEKGIRVLWMPLSGFALRFVLQVKVRDRLAKHSRHVPHDRWHDSKASKGHKHKPHSDDEDEWRAYYEAFLGKVVPTSGSDELRPLISKISEARASIVLVTYMGEALVDGLPEAHLNFHQDVGQAQNSQTNDDNVTISLGAERTLQMSLCRTFYDFGDEFRYVSSVARKIL